MYFPVLILLAYMSWRNVNLVNVVFITSLFIGGIVGSVIMLGIPDSGQFLYNIVPIANISLISFLIVSLSKLNLSNRFIRIESICIVILAFNAFHFDLKHYTNSIKPYNNIPKKNIVTNLYVCKTLRPVGLITGAYLISYDEIKKINYSSHSLTPSFGSKPNGYPPNSVPYLFHLPTVRPID